MLGLLLPGWAIPIECGIETSEGVKVSDVAAMTRDRDRRYRGVASIPEAPDICIEVLSWSNTPEEMDEKRRLYAAKGCLEFWTCSEDGKMTFFDAATGQTLPQSGLCPAFPPLIRLE
jgi:Uma2 family endonuclease